jgi:hypothetical protein
MRPNHWQSRSCSTQPIQAGTQLSLNRQHSTPHKPLSNAFPNAFLSKPEVPLGEPYKPEARSRTEKAGTAQHGHVDAGSHSIRASNFSLPCALKSKLRVKNTVRLLVTRGVGDLGTAQGSETCVSLAQRILSWCGCGCPDGDAMSLVRLPNSFDDPLYLT